MGDFEKGDQITIAEHYYVREVNGDRFLQTTDGYLPSSLKETYLFFLILNDQNEESTLFGIYTPVCGVMGRRPLTGDPADLRLGESAPRDYGSLHKKVLAKYGDEK